MATFILKSLATGYVLIAVVGLFMGAGGFTLILPIFFWPALLIVSGLAALVYKAIDEHKS